MSWIMLGGSNHAVLLGSPDPRLDESADTFWIVTKAPGLHDGIGGFDVEIGHWRIDPVDPHAACFAGGDLAAATGNLFVGEESERGRGGKVSQSIELLAATS